MKLVTTSRFLSPAEETLATKVFGATLPPWKRITIDAGLGWNDLPYTMNLDGGPGIYMIHIGPVAYPDCTLTVPWAGFGRIDVLFIHEMAHVWQYYKGYFVKLSSLWAQTDGAAGYAYTTGDPWDDYNVEQQASIVSNWYAGGMSTAVAEYQYVEKVVRRGGANHSLSLALLKTTA